MRKAKNTRLGHRFLARRNFVCTFVGTNAAETFFIITDKTRLNLKHDKEYWLHKGKSEVVHSL